MYLKALELRGFKSFPDKTRLEFEKGITAVVGPNGSGKSNISDAVRWVLGEMSPKSLRGSKMEDVVFAGTAKRAQTGFCEVSIIIDNSAHELPNDAQEVKVTRKYYRSGDSEYRINDKPSRLKDIYELFLNTGIGREGYSVVGQGKIAEVISQKSDERRHIFEEAAGISKYRYRKNDAEKKLAETDANIIRLNDITGEIGLRLAPLEKDAENAEKFLVLSAKKKELEVSLWLDRIIKASDKSKESENKYSTAKSNYENKDSELSLLDSEIEGLSNKKMFVSQNAENLRSDITEAEAQKNRLENLKNLSKNDIAHHNERKVQIQAEISFLTEKELVNLKDKLIENQTQLDIAVKALENANISLEKRNNELKTAEIAVTDSENALSECQDKKRVLTEELTNLTIQHAAEINSEKSEKERRDFLEAEIKKTDSELEEAYKALENANQRKKDFFEQKNQLNQEILTERKNLEQLSSRRDELLNQKNELEAKYAADSHRREVLDRMDKMLDGYPNSVKAVMNEKSLSGIAGPVSRILNVSGQYVTAIETALGAAVSNIVVEDEQSAKEAIRFLKRTNTGRATFLPLTSMTSRVLNERGLSLEKGYIGTASDLVSFDEKYRVIAENLLGRTLVADNIDNASVIARKYSYKFKIVTLDGQVVNAGGSYTGGSAAARTGVMSRNADIAVLEESISKLGSQMKKVRAEIVENSNERQSTAEYIESLRNDLSSADSGLYVSENDIKIATEHIDACSERLKSIHAQIDEFDSGKIKERLSELTVKKDAKEAEIRSVDIELSKLSEELDKADAEKAQAEASVSQAKLDVLSCQKDIESLRSSLDSSKALIADNVRRTQGLKEELTQIENQLSGINVDIEKLTEDAKNAEKHHEQLKNELAEKIAQAEQLELEISKSREKQRDFQRDKEVYFQEMTRLEALLEKSRTEYDDLTSKLWEEYNLTFTDAAALSLPAPKDGDVQELASVKAKIRALGHINVNAVEEYKETKERYDFMTKQISDLDDSKKSLENVIRRLEADMKTMFTDAIEKINVSFKEVFTDLFGGGTADIVISDPENLLESGIEINIQPPGKMVKNISLLSGGEQAFTAIALYFAILRVNPAPFYIFDEIEAALDDVNVNRFAAYVKKNSDTQFIIITHRRGTMEIADTMYGVTMQEKGVSSFLKVNIDDVEKKTGIKL